MRPWAPRAMCGGSPKQDTTSKGCERKGHPQDGPAAPSSPRPPRAGAAHGPTAQGRSGRTLAPRNVLSLSSLGRLPAHQGQPACPVGSSGPGPTPASGFSLLCSFGPPSHSDPHLLPGTLPLPWPGCGATRRKESGGQAQDRVPGRSTLWSLKRPQGADPAGGSSGAPARHGTAPPS